MSYFTIGSVVQQARKEKRTVTRKQLAAGLCSENTLYKIEKNQCEVSFLLMQILLQRLGKSPDKLEMILSYQEYQWIKRRDVLEKMILMGKREKAQILLKNFPQESSVDQMFFWRMSALLACQVDKDYDRAITYIHKAIKGTMPDFCFENMNECLISTIEMENILAMEKIKILKKETCDLQAEKRNLFKCVEYIDHHFVDEEEHAKIYSKCVWLLIKIYNKTGEYLETIQYGQKAMDYLGKFSILYFMYPILEEMVAACSELGISDEKNKWKKYKEALDFLWKKYAEPWYPVDILFHNCNQEEYHLDFELISAERKAAGMTQEKFIEGIYESPETLSRIENRKASPNKKHFEKIMQKLKMEKSKYNPFVVVESFEILKLRHEFDRLIMLQEYEQAGKVLQNIEKNLDKCIKENEWVLVFMDTMIKTAVGKITLDEAIEIETRLVAEFLDMNTLRFRHIPMRNEALLLNSLCVDLYENGNQDMAVKLYKAVIQCFEHSKVSIKYRFRTYSLILQNYAKISKNIFDCERVSKCHCLCGKGTALPSCMDSITFGIERVEGKSEKHVEWAKCTYYICDLFLFKKGWEAYKKYLEKDLHIEDLV